MSADPSGEAGDEAGDSRSSARRPQRLELSDEPPVDRFCDLVLTGGVADGVIYPWAIIEIARAYRFKSIGGTSVGAIAAALTAAAEFSRRRGRLAGFNEVLLKLPDKLAESINGKTRLHSLFQPAKTTRRLFELFVGFFAAVGGPSGAVSLVRKYLVPVLCAWRLATLSGLLAALAAAYLAVAAWWHCFVDTRSALSAIERAVQFVGLALPFTPLFVAVALVVAIYVDVVRLVENGYGMCKGGHVEGIPAEEKSLMEWLHEGIQGAAGRRVDHPLTFRDLWDAPSGPVEGPIPPAQPARRARSIDLRMIATNLSHGRPYQLPLDDDAEPIYFKVEELRPYFPQQVLKHLIRKSKSYRPGPLDPPRRPDNVKLRELPRGDLPIIVAARLSLSFPVLFSTVPLWAIERGPVPGRGTIRRCRFSDGGICSNFPIHMFDAAIPDWPTFGISLGSGSILREYPKVWLPRFHHQGREENWNRFDDQGSPLRRLGGFALAIAFSAKDWSDNTTMHMPGVRDRVVRIFLGEDQAGLNIKLSGDEILKLASRYGLLAGKRLVRKFTDIRDPRDPYAASASWHEHRWVRFNTFVAALRERIEGFRRSANAARDCPPFSERIQAAGRSPPLAGDDPATPSGGMLGQRQTADLEGLLESLEQLEQAFADNATAQPYRPVPPPTLHVRPPV